MTGRTFSVEDDRGPVITLCRIVNSVKSVRTVLQLLLLLGFFDLLHDCNFLFGETFALLTSDP